MKIVADFHISFAERIFSALGGHLDLVDGRTIDQEKLQDVDLLLTRSMTKVNASLIEGTKIRFVATATAGTDHVDLSYLKQKNIQFSSSPGCNSSSVAQYLISVLLTLQKQKKVNLEGKTLGILGLGNVGTKVKHCAEALGLRCLVRDPFKLGNKDTSLEEIIEESDLITLHVPLTKGGEHPTFHLVDESFLKRMKKGACLINASRGGVIDEKALGKFRNRLAALVLDVWEGEPNISATILEMVDLATPHIAGHSLEGKVNGTIMVYEAACHFLQMQPYDFWTSLSEYTQLEKIELSSDDPVLEAVTMAYDVEEDHQSFLSECERKGIGQAFGERRKNYPEHREFNHFQIRNPQICTVKQQKQLRNLGFRLLVD